jgi:hypothetical protein
MSPVPQRRAAPGLAPGAKQRFIALWNDRAPVPVIMRALGLTRDQVSYWRQTLALAPRRLRVIEQQRLRCDDRKRGRMSVAEIAELERLCATMKKPTPGIIAQRLNRLHATVQWQMIARGLIDRRIEYRRAEPYRRGKHTIHPYTRAEDERLIALRRQHTGGFAALKLIAAALTREFGKPRTAHGVDVRLKMLAAYDGGPEA